MTAQPLSLQRSTRWHAATANATAAPRDWLISGFRTATATTMRNLNKLWKNGFALCELFIVWHWLIAFQFTVFDSHSRCSWFFYAFYDAYQFCRPNLCKSYSVWWHFNCVRTVIRTVGVCWFWYSSRESFNLGHTFVTLLRRHFWLHKRSPEVSNRHIVSLKAINIQNFHFFIFKQIRLETRYDW